MLTCQRGVWRRETRLGKRKLTRKDFLRAAGASLLGSAALTASCGRADPSPDPPHNPPEGSVTNVVLVILDSLRRDHVGAYGNDWIRTPTLDVLAEEGLRFTRPYPDAMPTIPVRRAVHTGMRTLPSKAHWAPIPKEQTTLAEILKKEGYHTALVTDTYHQFEMNFGRGFKVYRKIRGQESDPYKDPSIISEEWMRERYLIFEEGRKARQYLANIQGQRKREEDWFAPKVFLEAMEALEEARRREPFLLVVDCYDPHEPWDPPEKFTRLYDPADYEGKEPLNDKYDKDDYLTDRQLLRMRALYSGEVTMADRWLGNFVEKAHDLGAMENTLLVVVSDHGHALGEHGYTGKPPHALWPELTDIVFLVRHPEGKAAGQASDYYASTHDVAPTILSLLGIEPPSPMEGQDLSVLLDGKEPGMRHHFTSSYYNYRWCRDEGYVMFCRSDGAEPRLYDVRNDPQQTRDLAEDAPETVEKMFKEYVLKDNKGSPPDHY
jgi:arylsulfatase A-like enzyme